jgi:hypothetical protein
LERLTPVNSYFNALDRSTWAGKALGKDKKKPQLKAGRLAASTAWGVVLTVPKLADITAIGTMPRRLIARLFLFVWLTLLGVEFVEQVGWFVFPDQAVDDSVDAAVVSLGVALKTSAPEVATAAPVFFLDVLSVRLIAVMLEYGGGFVFSREPAILGPPLPICKLYCTFLI